MTAVHSETIINRGKVTGKYQWNRSVTYLEQFHFWSANSFPRSIWLPKYAGHIGLIGPVANVVVRNLRTHKLDNAIVAIDPALQAMAESWSVEDRMHVGLVVVASAIHEYLRGELETNPIARRVYVNMINTGQAEELRQRAVQAIDLIGTEEMS